MASAVKNPQTFNTASFRLDTAETSITAPSTIITALAGTSGKLRQVMWVKFSAIGTATDDLIRSFFYDGTTLRYLGGDCDVVVDAAIPAPPTGKRPWSRMWHAMAAGLWDGRLTNTQLLRFTVYAGVDLDGLVGYIEYDA